MRSIKSRSRLASSNTRRPDFAVNSFSNRPFLQFIRSAKCALAPPLRERPSDPGLQRAARLPFPREWLGRSLRPANHQAGRANIIGVEPFEVCRDVFSDGIDRDTYFIRVEAVLRINDDAQMSSEIVEACADPYSIDLEVEEDGSLFAYAGL